MCFHWFSLSWHKMAYLRWWVIFQPRAYNNNKKKHMKKKTKWEKQQQQNPTPPNMQCEK